MSDNHLIATLFAACATLSTTTLVFAVAWLRARERAIRAELGGGYRAPAVAPDPDVHAERLGRLERLDRLERAIEAVAVEVERISEGQRFTTRLLTEQKGKAADALPAPRSPGRIVTPH